MENPLINIPEQTNETFIPFDKIKDEHFEPAFAVAFEKAQMNIRAIIENTELPTFENTIEALENCSSELDYIKGTFDTLKEADTNSEREKIAQIIAPQFAEFGNDIILNEKLFQRIKTVFDAKELYPTTKEVQRLLEKTYKSFVRSGALLGEEDKIKLREIDKEFSLLTQKFGENLLEATNEYELVIDNEKDLSGLPDRVIEAAKEEAQIRNKKDAWVFTLKAPSHDAIIQFADKPELREHISFALRARGMQGKTDNREIVKRIVTLRYERARLLGYKDHAEYILEERMAKTPETVFAFLETLYETAKPIAQKELNEIALYKEKITGIKDLNSWDTAYFARKLKEELFQFSEEDTRPYLKMDNVIKGMFEHARLLYGLTFKKRSDIPTYHADVEVFEVLSKTGDFAGLLYLDFFPRKSKRGGAWADMSRAQYKKDNKNIRPYVFLVCNFTKPTATKPSLLSLSEVETMFHEFGHALHCLLSECIYKSLSGYHTLWDFVELPSQLMESWVIEKESLEIFSQHYQTQESIPDELIQKIRKAEKFMAGAAVLGQTGSAYLDMCWHTDDSGAIDNVELFEEEKMRRYRFFPHRSGTSLSTGFKHIFNGGYDVGYYSYHWAEVLAADAFEYFKEKGIFSREVAEKFREHVLSKGNTEEPMELYKKFRGREPDPKALLRSRGLL